MTTHETQADDRIWLNEPGVDRRVSLVVNGERRGATVPGTGLTLKEIEHYQARGRRLQAQALGSTLGGLLRRLGSLIGQLAGALERRRQNRLAMWHLSTMDDYALKDIGLRRTDIPYVVTTGRHPLRPFGQDDGAAAEAPATPAAGGQSANNDAETREAA